MMELLLENTKNMDYVLVLTDPKREFDDEIAIWYMRNIAQKNRGEIFFEILCIDSTEAEPYQTEAERIEHVEGLFADRLFELDNFKIGGLSDGPKYYGYFRARTILQIAPMEKLEITESIVRKMGEYTYFLQGDTTTTNAKGGQSLESVGHFMEHGEKCFMFATKVEGKLRVPFMTYEVSDYLPSHMCEGLLQVTFKNVVGRAPARLKYLHQLVAPGGANYMSVMGLWNSFGFREKYCEFSAIASMDMYKSWKKHLTEYLKKEEYTEEQGVGFTIISTALEIMFGIDKIYFSDDPVFTQDPEDPPISTLEDAYRTFRMFVTTNRSVELSPGYDLVAAINLMSYLWFGDVYEEQIEHIDGNIWALKEEFCDSSYITDTLDQLVNEDEEEEEEEDNDEEMEADGLTGKPVNPCVDCGVDMGELNPRQLCGKTVCVGLGGEGEWIGVDEADWQLGFLRKIDQFWRDMMETPDRQISLEELGEYTSMIVQLYAEGHIPFTTYQKKSTDLLLWRCGKKTDGLPPTPPAVQRRSMSTVTPKFFVDGSIVER